MSSPVSSFKTAARISLGKSRAIKARADNDFWRMSQQESIEYWAPEIVLLRIRIKNWISERLKTNIFHNFLFKHYLYQLSHSKY